MVALKVKTQGHFLENTARVLSDHSQEMLSDQICTQFFVPQVFYFILFLQNVFFNSEILNVDLHIFYPPKCCYILKIYYVL